MAEQTGILEDSRRFAKMSIGASLMGVCAGILVIIIVVAVVVGGGHSAAHSAAHLEHSVHQQAMKESQYGDASGHAVEQSGEQSGAMGESQDGDNSGNPGDGGSEPGHSDYGGRLQNEGRLTKAVTLRWVTTSRPVNDDRDYRKGRKESSHYEYGSEPSDGGTRRNGVESPDRRRRPDENGRDGPRWNMGGYKQDGTRGGNDGYVQGNDGNWRNKGHDLEQYMEWYDSDNDDDSDGFPRRKSGHGDSSAGSRGNEDWRRGSSDGWRRTTYKHNGRLDVPGRDESDYDDGGGRSRNDGGRHRQSGARSGPDGGSRRDEDDVGRNRGGDGGGHGRERRDREGTHHARTRDMSESL